ncbi:MAG TPA: hybrid sensor histidine kinase/response regulator [Nitrospiraceae bacterium]|nr:hybrid sensor histidine kinase/response regulator [Nitrospiraceae bacterium]
MERFLARFAEESREHVARLNEGLIALEKNPNDSETIHAIFRAAHTIKGSSRMLKLSAISEIAHKLEDALGALRDKKIMHSKTLTDLLFRAVDTISDMIEKTAAKQELTAVDNDVYQGLAKAAEGSFSVEDEKRVASQPLNEENAEKEKAGPTYSKPTPVTADPHASKRTTVSSKTAETVRVSSEKLDDLIKLMGEIVSNQNNLKQRMREVKEIERRMRAHLEFARRLKTRSNGSFPDALLEEAHAVHAEIRQLAASIGEDINVQELLSGELQERTLIMRMVPLSTVFEALQRMVRDFAGSLGKEVDLIIEGGNIELDRKMIEKIGDPLVHMVRNAIDHGIEKLEDRVKAGKPQRGVLKISAYYDTGNAVIELGDDGNGIPLKKVREKALKRGIFTEKELDGMDDKSLLDLIFHPGFSTSEIITDISGRGVGMDVVKKNIVDDLKGAISVKTSAGTGTIFLIRLPLTLAIMPVILIMVSGKTFAIASHYVREIIRVPRAEFITVVDRTAIRLRNEFIPVFDLDPLLKMPGEARSSEAQEPLIIIVFCGSDYMGLIVDELVDEENMVIKSLPSHMQHINLVSGVTISSTNDIINILHIPAILAAAKETTGPRIHAEQSTVKETAVNILVVDDSINTREIEKSILESYGYRVTLAEDGMDGLEKAKDFEFDAVITDVEMPKLDGFSLTELLRKEESYKFTPIIIVTSREKEEDKRKGVQVGADAYIVKGSFDQSNLLETVQNLIGTKEK